MKHILLIATGGTIASVKHEQGLQPGLTGDELVRFVPEIADICHVSVIQLMNIDSTNMQPEDWISIATCIADRYDNYDGFVVMHGTDTMSYTAAALSYLVQNSPKPIVLTGSQKPMQDPFTDAKLNVFQSLLYAVDEQASDVSIVFSGSVIAGTRARKQRTMSHNAFSSINFPELAKVRNNHVLRPTKNLVKQEHRPTFYNTLNKNVCVLKLTPGVKPSIFEVLAQDYDGIIIETFGVGGIPEYSSARMSFKDVLYRLCDAGKTLVLTTQVPEEGCDMGVYEVGHAYTNHSGILVGDDMTTEALVAKTMWVLAHAKTPDTIRDLFYKPINYDRVGV